MFRISIILFTWILVTSDIKSQVNYHRGYILTNKNDTIYGLIKDRKQPPFAKIYKKIRFKSQSPFVNRLSPHQIEGYGIGDSSYESVWIKVVNEFFRTKYLSIPASGDKYFIKIIVSGDLTYYQWEYLDQESGTVDEISLYKRKNDDYLIRVTQGILGLREKSLKEYFLDCPDLIEQIERGQLKKPVDIAHFYNNRQR